MTATPAEKYAAMKKRRAFPELANFAGLLPFEMDEFQLTACAALESGQGALVAAPTGSGKTIVGEFAVHLALVQGRKCFFTTPIKALSNQKFNDLIERYGEDKVGLLTGDNSINSEAPVVVMTTEVLRNMLYANSSTVANLGYVVMDEVHYLADRSRGAVWEEVIIQLPDSVAIVSLSATVSNAEEFGDWLRTVRGDTAVVVEEKRPVPLYQHVLVGRKMLDLFDAEQPNQVNPELLKIARDDWASSRLKDRRSSRDRRSTGGKQIGNGRRVWLPSRVEMAQKLQQAGLLPGIVFIFSRNACDAAVKQCLQADLWLTDPDETERIEQIVASFTGHLAEADLRVLGYQDFVAALIRGVAAHHAGLLPAFKECVEYLFELGLCKIVFATETLALGINMPARSVVLEKLSKWNGETHVDLTPGEYTQLIGRAGRRGIDPEGHGVVLWQSGMNPKNLAGLAATRTYPLKSSFTPTYNMAVNLVNLLGPLRARKLLQQSFAQFQADRSVVTVATELKHKTAKVAEFIGNLDCHLGDYQSYAELRYQLSSLEGNAAKNRRAMHREQNLDALLQLKPGDIFKIPNGKYAGYAVLIETAIAADPRPLVITSLRQSRRLNLQDFQSAVTPIAQLKVPRKFQHRNVTDRRNIVTQMFQKLQDLPPEPQVRLAKSPASPDQEIAALREQLRAHPCHKCPDREEHAYWANRWQQAKLEALKLETRITSRTNSIATKFDQICAVLTELGYLDSNGVTTSGKKLMKIYTELDLVVAEAVRQNIWDGLSAAELAAVLTCIVFETRKLDQEPQYRAPKPVRDAINATGTIWFNLAQLQQNAGMDAPRQLDAGFAAICYQWALGKDLDQVLLGSELTAGDFVRGMKQTIDLCSQLANLDTSIAPQARAAVALLRRGIVDYAVGIE